MKFDIQKQSKITHKKNPLDFDGVQQLRLLCSTHKRIAW